MTYLSVNGTIIQLKCSFFAIINFNFKKNMDYKVLSLDDLITLWQFKASMKLGFINNE